MAFYKVKDIVCSNAKALAGLEPYYNSSEL